MIIDKYKTIFIHIPKNAGASVAEFFSKQWVSLRVQPNKHDTAYQIKSRFPELYNSYSKFAIIRNPYDRMVSWYFYLKRNALKGISSEYDVIPFEKWVEDPYKFCHFDDRPNFIDPQHSWVDETVVILRYENLKEDLNRFFEEEIDLPWVNKSNHENYLNYYNKQTLDIVYDRYKEDFEKYNYKKL